MIFALTLIASPVLAQSSPENVETKSDDTPAGDIVVTG
jgi:hypothetical protein